jgi:hypothetical protein
LTKGAALLRSLLRTRERFTPRLSTMEYAAFKEALGTEKTKGEQSLYALPLGRVGEVVSQVKNAFGAVLHVDPKVLAVENCLHPEIVLRAHRHCLSCRRLDEKVLGDPSLPSKHNHPAMRAQPMHRVRDWLATVGTGLDR